MLRRTSRPPRQQRLTARAVGWVLLAGAVETFGATPARTDEPTPTKPPTFETAVDVIVVDAVVTDGQGRPVRGLTADDFVVNEDGVVQALTSFEAVDLAPVAAARPSVPAVARRSSANDRPGPAGRVFVLVLDDAGLGLESAASARKAAKEFLAESTRPDDLVSVIVPGAGITWSARLPAGGAQLASIVDGVKGRRALTAEIASDWEARQIAERLDDLVQERARQRLEAAEALPRQARLPGETDESYGERNRAYQEPFLQADARRQLDRDRDRRRRLFETVSKAIDGVASLKGRKSVLLFSEGFVQEPNDQAFRDLVATLRRNNASIYSVDVQGLRSGMAADSRQLGDTSVSAHVADPRESAGADAAAEETGGFALHNPNDLEAGLARIAQESSSYYLLGYSSTNTKRDGKYRRLQVELRRPELRVRARKGYYAGDAKATRAKGKPGADPELERALASVVPATEIPLRLTAFAEQPVDPRRVRVQLVAEVGLAPLRFQRDADGSLSATLDVAMALNHVEPAGRQRTPWREWRVRIPPQSAGSETWVPLEGTFDVPAGACQARLLVRDRGSQAVGSVVHGFEVPDPRSWRVSTPILSDMPGEERGDPPRMQVGRSFVAGAPLYCYLEVYGGSERKAAAAPRASFAYTLVDARGKTRRSRPASPIATGRNGVPARLETIPLKGLSAGEYELRLTVRDEASGRTQELKEPFALRRPTHPDLAIYRELIRTFEAGDVERAVAGIMEWRPRDLAELAASLPAEETDLRRAALQLHTALAFRMWSNARSVEAEAQIDIGRALVANRPPPDMHRDWLLSLGYYQISAGLPVKALPYFAECARLYPDAADAWLGQGMCYEFTAFPDGFAFAQVPAQNAASQAEDCYREAVRLDPRLAEARLRLGRVLSLAGAYGEAEAEFSAALEERVQGPLAALAETFWGAARDARGDLAGAIDHYRAALAADGASQTAAIALSEALYRSGRRRDAALALAGALGTPSPTEISPWHAYHLGSGRFSVLQPAPHQSGPIVVEPEP